MTADVRTFRCLRLRLLVGHGAWSVASGRAERTRRVNRAELESATTNSRQATERWFSVNSPLGRP